MTQKHVKDNSASIFPSSRIYVKSLYILIGVMLSLVCVNIIFHQSAVIPSCDLEHFYLSSVKLTMKEEPWKERAQNTSSSIDFIVTDEDIQTSLMSRGVQNTTLIYVITPTYHRTTQMADLVSLTQTFMHDQAIHWIVIEDAQNCSEQIRDLLLRSGILFSHLAAQLRRVEMLKMYSKRVNQCRPETVWKGYVQRNLALQNVVEHLTTKGVVYFADDDNVYDLRLFHELRKIRRIGVFPVGFGGQASYERCVVDPISGKVSHFLGPIPDRLYAMDMAGFAVHTHLQRQRKARFLCTLERHEQETSFVQQLVTNRSEFEPLAENCTKIYTWHVKTAAPYGHKYENSIKHDTEYKSLIVGLS